MLVRVVIVFIIGFVRNVKEEIVKTKLLLHKMLPMCCNYLNNTISNITSVMHKLAILTCFHIVDYLSLMLVSRKKYRLYI